jgi:glycosyltransferase involved in cell wall biosynthesis
MKIALVTDAWTPQVNGVVTTLVELVRELELLGHQVEVVHPHLFTTRACPGYSGIDLAVRPYRRLADRLDAFSPDAIHLATEGPLGWAGRKYCLRRKLSFTTAFHTRFPEILQAALKIPLWLGYACFDIFTSHRQVSWCQRPASCVCWRCVVFQICEVGRTVLTCNSFALRVLPPPMNHLGHWPDQSRCSSDASRTKKT